ncbi:MAG: hypothetical protein ACRDMJ_11975, partial [Solirubrobacteraceae bacterium]
TFEPIAGTATLVQVDPHTNRIGGRPIRLRQTQPMAVAVAPGRNLWIATYDGPLLHFKLQSRPGHSAR